MKVSLDDACNLLDITSNWSHHCTELLKQLNTNSSFAVFPYQHAPAPAYCGLHPLSGAANKSNPHRVTREQRSHSWADNALSAMLLWKGLLRIP